MLYLTTRDKYDAYTAYNAKMLDRAADGGMFVPYQLPVFTTEEMEELRNSGFGKCVALMLNRFFSVQLTGWDVEFSVGRYPLKISNVTNRVAQVELWRNLEGSYEKMERNITAMVCGCSQKEAKITSWMRIAVRISVVTGALFEWMRQGMLDESNPLDIAVASADLSLAMAILYCKQMGLPIANVICSCGDNSPVWDLLNFGEIRLSGECSVPELERLIYSRLGIEEALRFVSLCENGGNYTLAPHALKKLREGVFTAVVSRERIENVISSVYRTGSCVLEAGAAIAYAGLMDYRAKTGENRPALVLADHNPADQAAMLAPALNISQLELKVILEKN